MKPNFANETTENVTDTGIDKKQGQMQDRNEMAKRRLYQLEQYAAIARISTCADKVQH